MAVTKKQLANLKRGGLTAEEAPRMGSKGGKKSVEVRRQRKAMRETLLELLQLPAESRPDKNNEELGLLAMLERWHKGDVSAGVFIRDTIGEKPVDRQSTFLQAEILTQEQIDAMVDAEKLGD